MYGILYGTLTVLMAGSFRGDGRRGAEKLRGDGPLRYDALRGDGPLGPELAAAANMGGIFATGKIVEEPFRGSTGSRKRRGSLGKHSQKSALERVCSVNLGASRLLRVSTSKAGVEGHLEVLL